MDTLYQYASLRMGWCLECHTQPPKEEDLQVARQRAAIWQPARESKGLYPRTIDVRYGVTRAATDCLACHY